MMLSWKFPCRLWYDCVKEGGKRGPGGDGTDVGRDCLPFFRMDFQRGKTQDYLLLQERKRDMKSLAYCIKKGGKKEKNKMPGFGLV